MLNGPLSAEHGAGGADPVGLGDIATMGSFGATMAHATDAAAAHAAVDDGSVAYRLGRAHAHIEAAISTPGLFGRVAIAQTMRDVAPVFRNMIAQYMLDLGRPNYTATK